MNSKSRLISLLVLLAVVIVGGFAYLTYSGQIASNPASSALISVTRPFPALTGPKTVTLSCSYHGKNLKLSETLYASLDDYYKSDPTKKIDYFHNDNKDFVFTYAKDNSIAKLTDDIKQVAVQNNLDSDQTLDLAACFMQSIPYDNVKAAKILSPNSYTYPVSEVIPRYPYETLYDFSGICTDKSYLGALVFKDLGYGDSLLIFDKERHMSVGVDVPSGYGDFGGKYAIMELTGEHFLVGDIPRISSNAGLAINTINQQPSSDNNGNVTQTTETPLSNPSAVTPIADGKEYAQIVGRVALNNELTTMRTQLDTDKAAILSAKNLLANWEDKLSAAEVTYKANPTNATYGTYLNVYNQYLAAYDDVQAKIETYNSLVSVYNSKVELYRQF